MMLKNRVKHYIGRFPSFFIPFYTFVGPKNNQKLLFQKDTELVIEGFPRSANTFVVVAFEQAQTSPVKIAHHLHVEAQLMEAAKYNVPAVALIRNPEDSFRSLKIRHPETPTGWMIKRYIHFYSAVEKLGDKCLIIPYEEIISDMEIVVDKINKRFASDFKIPIHNEGMVQQVFEEVESINQSIDGGKESHVARPSKERKERGLELDFSGYGEEINHAIKLYENLMSRL